MNHSTYVARFEALSWHGLGQNDSIVLLDRVRENRHLHQKESFRQQVGRALRQCMQRTIYLSVATMLSLLPFLFMGPERLWAFTLALLAGFAAGIVSTVCLVPAIIVDWHEARETVVRKG